MNDGMYVKPHTINHIEYVDGRDDYVADTKGKQVLSPETAWMTAYLERYNMEGSFSSLMWYVMDSVVIMPENMHHLPLQKISSIMWNSQTQNFLFQFLKKLLIKPTDLFMKRAKTQCTVAWRPHLWQ